LKNAPGKCNKRHVSISFWPSVIICWLFLAIFRVLLDWIAGLFNLWIFGYPIWWIWLWLRIHIQTRMLDLDCQIQSFHFNPNPKILDFYPPWIEISLQHFKPKLFSKFKILKLMIDNNVHVEMSLGNTEVKTQSISV